jgi:hypothetical protein
MWCESCDNMSSFITCLGLVCICHDDIFPPTFVIFVPLLLYGSVGGTRWKLTNTVSNVGVLRKHNMSLARSNNSAFEINSWIGEQSLMNYNWGYAYTSVICCHG